MEKLNIAEILKDCPKGMELDCTMYENVEFDYIEQNSELTYPIHCLMKINGGYNALVFTRNGCNDRHPNAKCVIFPKGKTTWEGFQRPFKDGDILVGKGNQPFIFKKLNNSHGCYSYCGIDLLDRFHLESDDWTFANSLRFATEEEKQKLFDAIKTNGYKWNPETKTLEKLVEPIFKVGDRVKEKQSNIIGEIIDVQKNKYNVRIDDKGLYLYFREQDDWELIPNKFDINTLKPFDKVLIRQTNSGKWGIDFFGFHNKEFYYTTSNCAYMQCIPYEGNEHLIGKTDDCIDYYKTW